MVKQGDTVRVDGKLAIVETSWGQGAHRMFKLNDGRTILDLDKAIEAGNASIEEPMKEIKWSIPVSSTPAPPIEPLRRDQNKRVL